jgi:uncharacterized membrane protein YbhN (UPF0104 family)
MPPSVPPPSSDSPTAWLPPRVLRGLSWVGSVAVLVLAAWLLRRYLGAISWIDVRDALLQLPRSRVAACALAMAVSFAMLAMFDVMAARIVAPRRISMPLAALAGGAAHALSNALGFHALTGSAVRYRVYATAGVGAADVARIVSLASLGVGLGYVVVAAAAFALEPSALGAWGRATGMALSVLLFGLLLWLRKPRVLRVRRWTLTLPGADVAAWQMLVGGIEMSAAVGAMYVLLPASIAPPFADFVPLYMAALLAGIVSHAPGGLGVFEAILLAAFPPSARAEVLAVLLCYRVIYNLAPFALALVALALFEARRKLAPHTA